jgi:ATP-dependent helicase/DNAse subunit B
MIELLIGPYRSGKTARLLRELIDYKSSHPLDDALILVPSQRYGNLLRAQLNALLQQQASSGIFGLRIATIYEACHQVIRNAGLIVRVLPRHLCMRAVSQALSRLDAAGQLNHLQAISKFPGTAGAIFRLIEEFERAALAPSQLLAQIESTAADSARARELALIYKEYWLRLDELQCLDQKRLAIAARELLSRKQVQGLHLRWLLVDGFDRISPLQAEIIDAFSRQAAHTRIAFDYVLPENRQVTGPQYDPQYDEYAWKDGSYAQLSKRFPEPARTISLTRAETRPRQFAFSTLDMFAELQETARRCKEAIVVRNIAPEQILVVARNIERYACAAHAAFAQAGLPFFIDEAVELISVPWIKHVLLLARLAINDFPRRQVIDLLRSRYCARQRLDLKPAEIDRIDRLSLEACVVAGSEQWRAALLEHPVLREKLQLFFALVTPPAVQPANEHARWLENMLDQTTVQFNEQRRGSAAAPTEEELQGVRGLRKALRTLLAESALFDGQAPVSFQHFLSVLGNLLQSDNFRRSQPTDSGIYICSAEHAPNRRFDEVFVVGAIEGSFPSHAGESGFVSMEERRRWQSFGVELANPREEPGFERALFRSLLERARKCFWVSFPRVDMAGDEQVPSFYLSDGTVDLGGIEQVDFVKQALLQPVAPRESVAGWLWHKSDLDIAPQLVAQAEIDEYWQQIAPAFVGAYQRHQSGARTPFNGHLTDLVEDGWLQLKVPAVWSASALNAYGQCPFRFWVSQMLGLERAREPQEGLSLPEKGKLYHRVLELYYSLQQSSPGEYGQVDEPAFAQALATAFSELERQPVFRAGPYWANDKKEIAFRLRRFLSFDSARQMKQAQFRPQMFEVRFGTHDAAYPPLVLNLGAGTVSICGVIDRVDLSNVPDGGRREAIILDYKSGSAAISLDDMKAGANLQLPIYAMAVERCILPGSKVTAGHFLSVNAAKSTGSLLFDQPEHAQVVAQAEQQIAAVVRKVTDGQFPVAPYASKACDSCEHATVCRIADLRQSLAAGEND